MTDFDGILPSAALRHVFLPGLCLGMAILVAPALAHADEPGGQATPPPPIAQEEAPEELRLLKLVNEARASPRQCGGTRFGATWPLNLDTKLSQVAQAHSQYMARNRELSSMHANGSSLARSISGAGYAWRAVGENVAVGQRTPEQVMAAWLRSALHCARIMSPRFVHLGVAKAIDPDSERQVYWSLVFATPN